MVCMKIHVNKLCNFKSDMHESSCQSKMQVMAFGTGAMVSFVANGHIVSDFLLFVLLNVL